MSRIALTPNASGTGTLTIAAPNTNTDRTLTLPDATGTVNISGLANEVPAGSAGAPAIYPTGDTNTGVFFPAADTVAIAANGATRFQVGPNGQIGVGVGAVSYGTGGQVMISQGAVLAATWGPVPAPTTAQVGTATADLAAGAVGSYALLNSLSVATRSSGATVAGSNLRYANTYTQNANVGYSTETPSGTWRLMGNTGNYDATLTSTTNVQASVWLRIS